MIGRFQVMALLQAARAYVLGAPLDEAESFGLNRAIFYAAAKRGFQRGTRARKPGEVHSLKATPSQRVTKPVQAAQVGKETAYAVELDGKKQYVIGEEVQEPADFHRQVASRFGPAFLQAWEQAVQLVEQADPSTLESPQKFYEEVYRPRRDELAAAWTELSKHAH